MSARERGYSILEMLVCLALLGLTLYGGWDLWEYGLKLGASAGRAMATPSFRSCSARLHRDVNEARAIVRPLSTAWTHGVLELSWADGKVVRYEQRGTALVRSENASNGGPTTRQRLLNDVSGFSCRVITNELVEIRITRKLPADPLLAASRQSKQGRPRREAQVEILHLNRRGGEGGASW